MDGLGIGTDVRLSGIKIGSVSDLTLDPKTYLVTVHMNIRDDIKIPDDSSLMVTSSGLLGSSYISLTPGGNDKMLAAGGMIQNSQGSVDLMGLVGRFIGSGRNSSQGQQPKPQQQRRRQVHDSARRAHAACERGADRRDRHGISGRAARPPRQAPRRACGCRRPMPRTRRRRSWPTRRARP